MSLAVSRRVSSLAPSSTLAVTARAKAMAAEGIDVVSYAAGEPDFDTPQPIKDAAARALAKGMTGYGPVPGDAPSRKAICEKLQRENRIAGLTPEHVVISSGGKHSLYNLFHCLLDQPGSGEHQWDVLLPTPAWVSYKPQAELAGGRVVELETFAEDGYRLSPERLRAAITPRSRILILNSPSNPCGTMYSPDELRALAAVVEDAAASIAPELVVITDEIYEKLVFSGNEHLSVGSIPTIGGRTVTVNGLSKAYAMTGWRIGYFAGSGPFGLELARAAGRLQGQMTTAIPTFLMPAIVSALTECDDHVERMRLAFEQRAELMHSMIRDIPGVSAPRPQGAMYVFVDVRSCLNRRSAGGTLLTSAASFAEALLEEQRVAVVPGEDFGAGAETCCRLTFACSEERIETGCARLAAFVRGIS